MIRFDDKREAGCLSCLCDFCPRLKVPQYFRTGSCRAGEGLYKWDGLCNVKIGEGRKKKIRVLCVREAGGRVVPVLKVLEDRMYYVLRSGRAAIERKKVETQLGYCCYICSR